MKVNDFHNTKAKKSLTTPDVESIFAYLDLCLLNLHLHFLSLLCVSWLCKSAEVLTAIFVFL